MARPYDIDNFNQLLQEHNQQLRAEKITGKEVVLSNGVVLDQESSVRLCKRRTTMGHDVWRDNFDRLYSTDIEERLNAEKECRSSTSVKGGLNCQKKHGEKIKNNLNTGIPWCKGRKLHYDIWNKGKTKYTDERVRDKLSKGRMREKNPMWGKVHSEEYKERQSEVMREKILSGEFTPNSNNRNTHWDSFYKDKKYRSSWEALYQYFDEDAEYETLRIAYQFNNKERIYIVDFVNHITKIAVEVKPKELSEDVKTLAKINAAKQWCKENGYKFLLVDRDYLFDKRIPENLNMFDIKTQNKIRNFYEISKKE